MNNIYLQGLNLYLSDEDDDTQEPPEDDVSLESMVAVIEGLLISKSELLTAVNSLHIRLRAIVGLLSIGYNQVEAAEVLGMSRTSVGVKYRQALEQLRQRLEEGEDAHMLG